jgi:hypothetical protein
MQCFCIFAGGLRPVIIIIIIFLLNSCVRKPQHFLLSAEKKEDQHIGYVNELRIFRAEKYKDYDHSCYYLETRKGDHKIYVCKFMSPSSPFPDMNVMCHNIL